MGKSEQKNVKTLDMLPEPVIVNIFKFMYPRDVAMVGATCRRLHMISNTPLVWQRFGKALGIDPIPEARMDKTSSLYETQLACPGLENYKYAVCDSYGKPIQDVGMTFDNVKYGRIRVGSVLIIHKHRPVGGSTNWGPGMDKFDGKKGVVTRLSGVDSQGCPGVRCSFDGEICNYFFRIRDCTIVSI